MSIPYRCVTLFVALGAGAPSFSTNQLTIYDDILGVRTIEYNTKDGYALVEGDILIGQISRLKAPSAHVLPKLSGKRWPHGIIPFRIDELLPFDNKLAVYQAIDVWRKTTRLAFIELTSQNEDDYPDYLLFKSASGTTCASHVGMQGGAQPIRLAPRCHTMNTVHEIGHALGLWHEQSRQDRDNFVTIVWENIKPEQHYNFNQHLTDGVDYAEYDYDSIMHYGPLAFSKNGEKTIIPLQEGVTIGQRVHLSTGDIAAVNAMYPEL